MFKRVILIILDGVGIGALPDADDYGDAGCATLQHVAEAVGGLDLPCLKQLGLGNIATLTGVAPVTDPEACWGKMGQLAVGKDSVVGHWELAGVIQEQPFATFPSGFPQEIIEAFSAETGLPVLGNISASGTEILVSLGEEHLQSGAPIIYTSVDSVLQIAAHEKVIPPEQLYELCHVAERIVAPYRVCRVIARPFIGESAATFRRTSRRHDFPCSPTRPTLVDQLQKAGVPTCSIGKVVDLFAGKGFDHSQQTVNNADGMNKIVDAMKISERGLVFANLIDFDMLYGHRRDFEGYALALAEFDRWLPSFQKKMAADDLLIISADHGCDPTAPGTDHTREYVPLLVWSPVMNQGVGLGVRKSFSDVGATIAEQFSIDLDCGTSFLSQLRVSCSPVKPDLKA